MYEVQYTSEQLERVTVALGQKVKHWWANDPEKYDNPQGMLCPIRRCSLLPDLWHVDMGHVERELCISCRCWEPSGIQRRCFKGQWADWGSGCATFFLETQNFHFYHLFLGGFAKFGAVTKELKHLTRLIKPKSQSLHQIIWIFPLEWIYLIDRLREHEDCFRFRRKSTSSK